MEEEFKADLHCHSTCSDGEMTPEELLHAAYQLGLKGLSITDHDTVDAYTEEVFALARSLDIYLCTGVEFSCQLHRVSIHILGYGFDVTSPELLRLCQRHQLRRMDRNLHILKKLAQKGMPIAEEELIHKASRHVIGRPHIAHLMIEKGYVSSVAEAFHRYIGDGKSCFDPGEEFSVDETIDVLHAAGGKAFIAHPHLINRKKIVRALLEKPFDGLECYYGSFKHHDNEKWIHIAQDKGWLISGGSDFHGALKPYIHLGTSWVDRETFSKIVG